MKQLRLMAGENERRVVGRGQPQQQARHVAVTARVAYRALGKMTPGIGGQTREPPALEIAVVTRELLPVGQYDVRQRRPGGPDQLLPVPLRGSEASKLTRQFHEHVSSPGASIV